MSRPSGSSIVTKARQLLDVITEAHRPLKFSEIVERTGFVKSSCHRLLAILQGEQLIEFDAQTRTYRSGHRLQKWARAVWNRADIQQIAAPYMTDLCEQTGMNTALSTLDTDSVLYLRTIDFFNARFASHAGDRASLHATAAGKVFLAYLTPARQQAVLNRITLEKYTEFTIVSQDELLEQCVDIRATGIAVADREEALQVTGIAAPIWSGEGALIASLSLWSSSEHHLPEEVRGQADAVKAVSTLISAELGSS